MALLQNGFRDASSGVRTFGATASNNAYPGALGFHDTGSKRNIFTAQGYSPKSGIPSGHLHPSSWMLPMRAGGLSAHNNAQGVASWSGSIAAGRNLAATFAGAATFTGTGQLVVSGSGSFAGVASFSGNVIAALAASGTFAGSASFSGAVVATGHMAGAFAGVASFTAVRYATGSLSGSFAPPVSLEAAGFSTYLLDEEDVETGLTLRQALRLVTAATAGKISGGGTATVTIRNAVADGVDRIVATVDNDGNRTAITYELD
jgi:hypothetical protein